MTFNPDRVDAVVFDIGGVFTYPTYQPVHDHLSRAGLPVPADIVEYRRAHHAAVLALTRARQRRLGEPGQGTDYWAEYDIAYGTVLGVDDSGIDELRPAIRTDWDWVHDDNVAAFAHLVTSGVPAAIVSNNDGTAADRHLLALWKPRCPCRIMSSAMDVDPVGMVRRRRASPCPLSPLQDPAEQRPLSCSLSSSS